VFLLHVEKMVQSSLIFPAELHLIDIRDVSLLQPKVRNVNSFVFVVIGSTAINGKNL
jgi:hypothetical protein